MNLGLDYQLGDDINALRETVKAFDDAEIAPRAAELDRTDQFPMDLWQKMGELEKIFAVRKFLKGEFLVKTKKRAMP